MQRLDLHADGHIHTHIEHRADDQGYDDVGLNNPRYVNTPNLDAFMRSGTRFDNFYVTPQCAQVCAMRSYRQI